MSILPGRFGLLLLKARLPLPLEWQEGRYPLPPQGLVLGRGVARFRVDAIGGRRVKRFRSDLDDPANATEFHLFRSCTIAPLLTLKRRLRMVADLFWSISCNGFTLARSLDLSNQWSCIVDGGSVGAVDWTHLVAGPAAGLDDFAARVADSIDRITDFVHQVVVHRRDFAVRCGGLGFWRTH